MLPLTGRRIVVTRARAQAGDLLAQLSALGAEALACPAIAFAPPTESGPLDAALRQIDQFDQIVLTSANAVQYLFARMATLEIARDMLGRVQISVIGPATAHVLATHGGTAQLTATEQSAEGLLQALGNVAGQHILLPAADLARDTLADGLRAAGATVHVVTAYRTVPGDGAALLAPILRTGAVDASTFTSPSTVHYLLAGLAEAGIPPATARTRLGQIVCIGPTTAAAASEAGLHVAAQPSAASNAQMVAALLALFQAA